MKKCSTFLANRTNQNHFKNSTLLLLEWLLSRTEIGGIPRWQLEGGSRKRAS
jgi:hypothetical protein